MWSDLSPFKRLNLGIILAAQVAMSSAVSVVVPSRLAKMGRCHIILTARDQCADLQFRQTLYYSIVSRTGSLPRSLFSCPSDLLSPFGINLQGEFFTSSLLLDNYLAMI